MFAGLETSVGPSTSGDVCPRTSYLGLGRCCSLRAFRSRDSTLAGRKRPKRNDGGGGGGGGEQAPAAPAACFCVQDLSCGGVEGCAICFCSCRRSAGLEFWLHSPKHVVPSAYLLLSPSHHPLLLLLVLVFFFFFFFTSSVYCGSLSSFCICVKSIQMHGKESSQSCSNLLLV